MAQCFRYAMLRTLAFAILAGLFMSTGAAQSVQKQLGALELSVDAKSWRIERPAQHILNLVPIGTMAKTARRVVVTQAASNDLRDCEVLARAQLPETLYEKPTSGKVDVGGVKAVAVHARTRCRNATPNGIAVCIPHRGIGYVLVNRVDGCRTGGGNPFSGSDWFENLIKGILFVP